MIDQLPKTNHYTTHFPSANEDVAKLRLELNHKTLNELIEDGLVKLDEDNSIVKKGPYFDKKRPLTG